MLIDILNKIDLKTKILEVEVIITKRFNQSRKHSNFTLVRTNRIDSEYAQQKVDSTMLINLLSSWEISTYLFWLFTGYITNNSATIRKKKVTQLHT